MAELEFDEKKIILVDIDKVVPNSWNPKDKDTKEYRKIVESIKANGLRGYINVREHPHTKGYYEILDGEQRYTGAKELKIPKIYVYNDGEVSEQKAQELTIWYQQQVPFNRITEAYLVTQMVTEFGLEDVSLPYSEAEINEFKEIADFNFDLYKPDEFKENEDGSITFAVKLTKLQNEIVKSKLEAFVEDNHCTTAEALTALLENA